MLVVMLVQMDGGEQALDAVRLDSALGLIRRRRRRGRRRRSSGRPGRIMAVVVAAEMQFIVHFVVNLLTDQSHSSNTRNVMMVLLLVLLVLLVLDLLRVLLNVLSAHKLLMLLLLLLLLIGIVRIVVAPLLNANINMLRLTRNSFLVVNLAVMLVAYEMLLGSSEASGRGSSFDQTLSAMLLAMGFFGRIGRRKHTEGNRYTSVEIHDG